MKSMFPRSPDLKVSTLQAAIRKANHYLAQGVGIAALAAVGATAQAAEEEKKEKEISEEIIVKGIRGSLAEASALKRNANGFLDAIVAEDIGKLPDNNIAEALQRVTGVQIGRTNGEGSFVSLRGLDQTFTQVTVNGQEIQFASSNEGSRNDGVNFRSLASSVASVIEVIKSPTAKLDEGGIGGTVNVIKRRPLDIGERLMSASVNANIEPDSDDGATPNGSFFYSDVFADDTFGISFSADIRDRNFTRTQDGTNRRDISVIDPDGDADNGDEIAHIRRVSPEVQRSSSDSTTFSGTIQWQPSDSMNFYVDVTRADEQFRFNRSTLELRFQGNDVDLSRSVIDPETDIVTDLAILSFSDRARVGALAGTNDTTTRTWAGGFEWDISERFHALFEYSGSDVSFDTNNFPGPSSDYINDGDPTPEDPNDADSTPRDIIARLVFDGEGFVLRDVLYDFSDPNNLEIQPEDAIVGGGFFNLRRNNANQDTFRAQFTLDLDDGGSNSLEFGLKFQNIEQEDATFRRNQCTQDSVDEGVCTSISAVSQNPFQSFIPAFGALTTQTLLEGLTYATYDPSALSAISSIASDQLLLEPFRGHGRSDDFRLGDRDITVAYLQLNFANDDLNYPFRGNAGVRFVHTDTTVTSFATDTDDTRRTVVDDSGIPAGFTPISVQRSYTEVLPSFNVAFDLSDNLIFRAAAARVMDQPRIRDLAPFVRVTVPTELDTNGIEVLDLPDPGGVVAGAGEAGNPDLDPFIANQLDLAIEHYDDVGSYSVGFFYKDIQNFIAELLEVRNVTAVSHLDGTTEINFDAEFDTPINAGGAEAYGFELGFQRELTFLPIDGFGVVVNYTRTEVSTDLGIALPGTSENTYNLIGYYEKGPVSFRAAYNYRDGFPIDIVQADAGVVPESFDTVGLLDLSFSYDITDSLRFQASAINVTDEVQEQQLRTLNLGPYMLPGDPTLRERDDFTFLEEARFTGRAFTFGLNYQF